VHSTLREANSRLILRLIGQLAFNWVRFSLGTWKQTLAPVMIGLVLSQSGCCYWGAGERSPPPRPLRPPRPGHGCLTGPGVSIESSSDIFSPETIWLVAVPVASNSNVSHLQFFRGVMRNSYLRPWVVLSFDVRVTRCLITAVTFKKNPPLILGRKKIWRGFYFRYVHLMI